VAAVAPTLLVLLWSRHRDEFRWFAGHQPVAVVLQLASPMIVAALVFAILGDGIRFPFLVLIPIVLVALRFGYEGAAFSTLGLAPLVTALAADLDGADAVDRAELQTLLLIGICTGLIVGAVVSERERLGRLHRELSAVVETTPDLVSIVDADGRLRYLNPAARAVAGLSPDDDIQTLRDTDLARDPVAAEATERARVSAQRDGYWMGDVDLRSADGKDISGSKVVVVHQGRNGDAPHTTAIVRDMTEQRRLEQQLTRRALYDDITGLPNHALLVERIDHARRREHRMVLLVAIIDRFAVITEGVGHQASEAVVREVGRRLVERLGPADTVARIDNDTFGILVDRDLDELAACTLGDRLIAEVGGHIEVGSRPVPVAISMGAAAAADLHDGDDLIRAAEVAARRAIEVGGARTVLYSQRMADTARHRLDAEVELREAIDGDRWWLAYQPIIDLRTDRVVSCEALLRWTDASGEAVSPYEFIVLAEETGLIVPLGKSVLERACLDTLGWANHGERVTVSVNVSARQLAEPGFTESFAEVLEHTGIDPGVVTVELTETSFAGDPAAVGPLLDDLSRLGVELAMDDFGTGYSSLAQLGGLPLRKVKLDKSFIDDLATSARCRHLVQGVITLAHALGLVVIAEGVEHEAQLAILRELGCDRAQGFLFSRPVPPEELSERLEPDRRDDLDALDPATRARLGKFG
jgi:diguanylate cyclase (GGDEF)-like protein/PAS domain S-box-containing protein